MLNMSGSTPLPTTDALVIRPAYPDDHAVLARLARLDSQTPLRAADGPVLVAERDATILAAYARASGRAIADPFAPTADLVALLRLHAVADRSRTATPRGARAAGRDFLRRAGATARRRPALARG
jgi:hypothetical protein